MERAPASPPGPCRRDRRSALLPSLLPPRARYALLAEPTRRTSSPRTEHATSVLHLPRWPRRSSARACNSDAFLIPSSLSLRRRTRANALRTSILASCASKARPSFTAGAEIASLCTQIEPGHRQKRSARALTPPPRPPPSVSLVSTCAPAVRPISPRQASWGAVAHARSYAAGTLPRPWAACM